MTVDPWNTALPLDTVTVDDVTGIVAESDTIKLPPCTTTVDELVTWNCDPSFIVKFPDVIVTLD